MVVMQYRAEEELWAGRMRRIALFFNFFSIKFDFYCLVWDFPETEFGLHSLSEERVSLIHIFDVEL